MTPLRRSRHQRIDSTGHQNKSKGTGNTATGFNRDNGIVAFGDPLKLLENINQEVKMRDYERD